MGIKQFFAERKERKTKERTEAQTRQEEYQRKLDAIKLFNQSYEEARRTSSVGELELISAVRVTRGSFSGADESLKAEALELGAQYVFGINYHQKQGAFRDEDLVIAHGDAYKSKNA